jgi:hypothetical protein
MKKILYTFYLGAALATTSCADLDQTPASSIDKEQFYQTKEDAEAAVNGIYAILTNWTTDFQGMYNNLTIYMGDLTTEYVRAGANTNSAHIRELHNMAVQPNNVFVQDGWEEVYIGVNRANVVVDRLSENTAIDGATRDRFINEAKFLRALYYFNAVRWWGDIPLVLHDGDGDGLERTPRDEVYAQIVQDLKDASGLPDVFPGSAEGRATKGAALATLSKVYLTWAQTDSPEGRARSREFYQSAADYAGQVIALDKYALFEEFTDIHATDKKNGIEHIFSIQHANSNNVSGHCVFAMGWSDSEPVLIVQDIHFYNDMDDADQRKHGSFAKTLWNPNTNSDFTFEIPLFRKYIDTINYAKDQFAGRNTNNVYIRYAEVLLIKAEALNEISDSPPPAAYEAINQVRRRAYRFPVTSPAPGVDLEGLAKDEFRAALQKERFNEFILEGQHWFDLVRWKILVKTIRPEKPSVSLKNYLFPIPGDQIILNPKLIQNWGYGGETSGSPYEGYE